MAFYEMVVYNPID